MKLMSEIAGVTQGLSTFGRGAGASSGELPLHMIESGDLGDTCWVDLTDLRKITVADSGRIERHLLRPHDVLVTARTGSVQAALVPPGVSRTVASVTLLVVRPHDPESGMGHFLWYFLMSSWGQVQLQRKVTVSSTMTTLSASNLGEVEVPIPSPQQLDRIASLVEASEEAYAWAVKVAQLRREAVRDSIIGALDSTFGTKS